MSEFSIRAMIAAPLALGAAVALAPAAPASAEPRVITAPSYVPARPAAEARRYYDDGPAVRRVITRNRYSRSYVEEIFEEDAPAYRYERRRVPTARERSIYRTYDAYDAPRRLDRQSRVYRYYDEDDAYYDPYESRDPVVEPMPRRLAGPPSGTGGDVMRRTVDPKFARQIVPYRGSEPANSIVIDTRQRFLYLIQGDGTAIRYGVGVGKEGFTWKGVQTISSKKEWPDWRPPAEMRQRRPELPVFMAGGPDNPLGARALYLGNTLYRIHGSNEPWTIGRAVSSGCIRMTNEDVTDLYDRVGVGTVVKVI